MSSSPRNPTRILVASVLGALIVATSGVGVWYLVNRDSRPGGPNTPNGGTDEHPVTFELTLSRVGIRSVASEPSRGAVDAAAEGVRTSVQDLYLAAFVDPDRWAGGAFPDAFATFEPEAEAAAREDLNALTLGAAADRLEWVEPSKGRCSIVFLLDDESRPVTAVAGVVFEGTGHLHDGTTVGIVNGADLVLRPIEGQWRVFSFTASTNIAPPKDEPASPAPTGTAP